MSTSGKRGLLANIPRSAWAHNEGIPTDTIVGLADDWQLSVTSATSVVIVIVCSVAESDLVGTRPGRFQASWRILLRQVLITSRIGLQNVWNEAHISQFLFAGVLCLFDISVLPVSVSCLSFACNPHQ